MKISKQMSSLRNQIKTGKDLEPGKGVLWIESLAYVRAENHYRTSNRVGHTLESDRCIEWDLERV